MWPFKKFQAEPFDVARQRENKVKIDGASLKDILMDDQRSVLFGKMLERDKAAFNIFLKLRKSQESLSSKDFDKLVEYKKTFEKRFAESEEVRGLLTRERFFSLAKNSDGLAKSLEVLGADASYGAIHSSLEILAIKGDENFLNMKNKLVELVKIEKNTRENNEKITAWCQKYKIETSKISEIFTKVGTLEEERYGMLEKVIEDSLGFWQRGPRVTIDENIKKRLLDLGIGSDENLIAKIKPQEILKAQEGVASILNLTLSKNEEVLKAVTKNLRPEVKTKEEEVGGDLIFSNLNSCLGDEKEALEAWEGFKSRNPLGKGEAIDDDYVNDFKKSYTEKKMAKKAGFWTNIAQSFMKGFLGELEFN